MTNNDAGRDRVLSEHTFEHHLSRSAVDTIQRNLGMPLRGLRKETEVRAGHVLIAEDGTGATVLRMYREGPDRYSFEFSTFQEVPPDDVVMQEWENRVLATIEELLAPSRGTDPASRIVERPNLDLDRLRDLVVRSADDWMAQRPTRTASSAADAWLLVPFQDRMIAFDFKWAGAETAGWVGGALARVGETARDAFVHLLVITPEQSVSPALDVLEEASPARFGVVLWHRPDRLAQVERVLRQFMYGSLARDAVVAYDVDPSGLIKAKWAPLAWDALLGWPDARVWSGERVASDTAEWQPEAVPALRSAPTLLHAYLGETPVVPTDIAEDLAGRASARIRRALNEEEITRLRASPDVFEDFVQRQIRHELRLSQMDRNLDRAFALSVALHVAADLARVLLEPGDRHLFELVYVHGLSLREIALSLDAPESIVLTDLRRIAQELRERLDFETER